MALSQREKRLLALPVLIGAVFGFYSYVHEPLFTRRAEAAVQVEQVSSALQKDQAKLARVGNLAILRDAVAARERVIDAWVPGKDSAALLIWYLSDAEKNSGARIKSVSLSEPRQVAASQAKLSSTPGQQPSADPAAQQPGTQTPNADTEVMLTVIDLTLKAEGYFLQHQEMNRKLEAMPLFLDTKALALDPIQATFASTALLGQLIQGGHTDLARDLAELNPKLDGTYQISLYFRSEMMGPDTSVMTFSEEAGKLDPFAREAGIEELINAISAFFARQPNFGGSRGPLPPLPDGFAEQLG